MHTKGVIPGIVRAPKRTRQRRVLTYLILTLIPIGVWFVLMEAYLAYAPVDQRLEDRGADSIVALPHGTTLLEPRGTAGRNIADWLATHPQGVRSFEVGGNQFLGDTAEPTAESVARIGRLAAMLKAAPDVSVTVVGQFATGAYHGLRQELAVRRAQSVRLELMRFGIAGDRIAVESRGTGNPYAPQDSARDRDQDARVALVLIHNDTSD